MKKKLIIFTFLVAIHNLSFSQKKNVSVGPIIGLNYSKVSANFGSAFKPGFVVGLFLNYSTKTNFGFNGSLLYAQLGGNVKNSDNYIRLSYLQLPVNVVYYFGHGLKQGSFRPKIFVGPYIGYLIDAKSPGFTNEQTLAEMNDIDFGVNIGTGFNLAIGGQKWLNVDLKYGHGLTDVRKIVPYQNRNLSLNAGISFALGNYDKKTGKLK
jgi:hypothetical protein